MHDHRLQTSPRERGEGERRERTREQWQNGTRAPASPGSSETANAAKHVLEISATARHGIADEVALEPPSGIRFTGANREQVLAKCQPLPLHTAQESATDSRGARVDAKFWKVYEVAHESLKHCEEKIDHGHGQK